MKNYLVKSILLVYVLCHSLFSFSQIHNNWTKSEVKDYATLNTLCKYLLAHEGKFNIQDSVLVKYILLDYIFNDTSKERIAKRNNEVSELLLRFRRYVDSTGLENLDAMPIRFYKADTIIYKPFENELKDERPFSFVYFNKKDPKTPIGYLLFDPKSHKLVSWILLNQGGYRYFLTFNQI